MPQMTRVKFKVAQDGFKKGEILYWPEDLVKQAPEKFEVDPVEDEPEAPKAKAKPKK